MPFREEDPDFFVPDFFGRVMVTVMPRATIGAVPETIRERKLLVTMTTARTQLRRWEPTINEDKVSVAPLGFVFDLPEGFAMRRVVDRFGKLGFRHAFEVQRLAHDRVVSFYDRSREFMSEVGAFVRNLFVLTGQSATGFCPVRAAFLATGQSAI